jgi:hypothetical protein
MLLFGSFKLRAGVPYFEFLGDRDDLNQWASKQGEEKLSEYRSRKNKLSLDGKTTGCSNSNFFVHLRVLES